jgi:hypothetical protein
MSLSGIGYSLADRREIVVRNYGKDLEKGLDIASSCTETILHFLGKGNIEGYPFPEGDKSPIVQKFVSDLMILKTYNEKKPGVATPEVTQAYERCKKIIPYVELYVHQARKAEELKQAEEIASSRKID